MIREHCRTLGELSDAIRVSEDVLSGWQSAGMPRSPNGWHIRRVLEWARRRGLIRVIETPSEPRLNFEDKLLRSQFDRMTRRRFPRRRKLEDQNHDG